MFRISTVLLCISLIALSGCSGYFAKSASEEEAVLENEIHIGDQITDVERYLRSRFYRKQPDSYFRRQQVNREIYERERTVVRETVHDYCWHRVYNRFPAGTIFRDVCFSDDDDGQLIEFKLYQFGAGL